MRKQIEILLTIRYTLYIFFLIWYFINKIGGYNSAREKTSKKNTGRVKLTNLFFVYAG